MGGEDAGAGAPSWDGGQTGSSPKRRFPPEMRGPETWREYLALYLDVLELLEHEGKHEVVLFITGRQHPFHMALARCGSREERREAASFRRKALLAARACG